MLFNSFEFAVFFSVVYGLYLVFSHKWQNRLLLVASYVFYGAWNWKFLSLIWISTVIDYFCGLYIYHESEESKRKKFLFISVFSNLSILGFFKYYNFFVADFQSILSHMGIIINTRSLDIVLPVGISFYTFQTLSYSIDIYKKELPPTRNFFDFALFVAFFPQLVAGPIERAKRLLPQILTPRRLSLELFYDGCFLIFWGLFQKMVIADNLAKIADPVFGMQVEQSGVKILIAIYAFSFQIFCDFAGYSNIARGLGKVMGFDIMINFNIPYVSTNPREFWRRWHISLSNWLRDYLYIPLGGSRQGTAKTYRNLFITMFLCGLWHGAANKFILWGIYHGMILIIYRNIVPYFKYLPTLKNKILKNGLFFIKIMFFFQLVSIGWLIFRADSPRHALSLFIEMLSNFHLQQDFFIYFNDAYRFIFFISILIFVEVINYLKKSEKALLEFPPLIRAPFYATCFFLILIFGISGGKEFVYFQF